MQFGPDEILVNLELELRTGEEETAAVLGRVERTIRERFPKIQRIFFRLA